MELAYVLPPIIFLLQVNTNGVLSFRNGYTGYSPVRFPLSTTLLIAPYWDDVYTPSFGTIFYRQSADPSVLQTAQDIIRGFNVGQSFTPTALFIATWDHVAECCGGGVSHLLTLKYMQCTQSVLYFKQYNGKFLWG